MGRRAMRKYGTGYNSRRHRRNQNAPLATAMTYSRKMTIKILLISNISLSFQKNSITFNGTVTYWCYRCFGCLVVIE